MTDTLAPLDGIPDFLRLTPEQRREAWIKNPPTTSARGFHTDERLAEEKRIRTAYELDQKAKRALKDQPRFEQMRAKAEAERAERTEYKAKLEEASAATKAHWTPEPKKENDEMATKAKTKPKAAAKANGHKPVTELDRFGLREGTNYHRMVKHLLDNKGKQVPVEKLARVAYELTPNQGPSIAKAVARVVTMSRIVQERHIAKHKLPFIVKRDKDDNGTTIGLHGK